MQEELLTLVQAAAYLKMPIRRLRDHIYPLGKGDLVPDDRKDDWQLLFKPSTLDEFKKNKRRPGRPSTVK